MAADGPEAKVLIRIKRTAALLSAAGAIAAYLVAGARAAVSLTIGAVIVIFNFFVLEKVTAKFLTPRTGMRFSDFAVPAGGFAALLLLLAAIMKWKGFNFLAGVLGLSVIVVAIGIEGLRGFGRG